MYTKGNMKQEHLFIYIGKIFGFFLVDLLVCTFFFLESMYSSKSSTTTRRFPRPPLARRFKIYMGTPIRPRFLDPDHQKKRGEIERERKQTQSCQSSGEWVANGGQVISLLASCSSLANERRRMKREKEKAFVPSPTSTMAPACASRSWNA